MSSLSAIPVLGPGSQSRAEDELAILQLPSGMETYASPRLPEPEETAGLQQSKAVLEALLDALRTYTADRTAPGIDISHLDAADRQWIDQVLGEGEVSVRCDGAHPVQAQESVLAGVWRVRYLDGSAEASAILRDTLEVGAIPGCVKTASYPQTALELPPGELPSELMNAPTLLVEIRDQLKHRQPEPSDPAHVINLTLLPLSDFELAWLGERLGLGPVTILSRGYGNCRIGSTAYEGVWWIKYYNSEDKLILNTIEITALPEVALAAPEDIEDSAERLQEILALYQ